MTLAQAQQQGFEQGSTLVTGSGSGSAQDDTLVLDLSEDAYKGDAQFLVKLDGAAISGPTMSQQWHQASIRPLRLILDL